MSELRVFLLGAPEAEVDGQPVVVDTRKATALLAYLAVEGRRCRRDSLAGLLWPDYSPEAARGALRRTLSSLKKGLGGGWLDSDRAAVALVGDGIWVDAAELTAAARTVAEHGHQLGEPCGECRTELEHATKLYRGDFMEGFSLRDSPEFEDWQMRWSDDLRHTLYEVLERLVESRVDDGDLPGAAEQARHWLSLDPLHEPAHRRLMHLYALQGRRSDALRQYRECVSVLEKELGVEPLPETTELYEAILQEKITPPEPAAPETVAPPTIAAGSPLVGRKPEMTALNEALDAAESRGRLVVLEGEAGIGKSRLAEDFLLTATQAGSRAVTARCYEDESELAYAPIADALRALAVNSDVANQLPRNIVSEAARLVPEIAGDTPVASPAEGPGARTRFLDGVTETLFAAIAGTPPGILFIDDVHWADEASIDLLTYALRRLRDHHALVVLSWRLERMPTGHRLRRVAAQMRADGAATVMPLSRLDRKRVIELVKSARPELDTPEKVGERMYEETEGLPFFVVEYLAAMKHQDPDSVDWTLPAGAAGLLESRVTSVGDLSRQVMTAAAIIGRSFDFDTLRDVSGRGEDETVASLDELIEAGLVRELDGVGATIAEYDFSHEQLRTFVYSQAGLARTRLLHRRAADILVKKRRMRSEASSSALIARHYRLGGDDAEAARHFHLAGQQAAAVFANLEALTHFESALALGHADVSSIREAIGDVCTLLGRYREAVAAYESSAAVSEDSGRLAVLEHKLGQVHHRSGSWHAAESHYASALEVLGDARPALAASISADRSLTARLGGRMEEALDYAHRALQLAEFSGDTHALAQAHNILGILNGDQSRPEEARNHLEMSLQLAGETEEKQARVAALNNLALLYGRSGEIDRAIDLTRTGLQLCASLGDRHREAALHNNLADLLRAAGRIDEAIEEVKTAAAMFADVGESDEMEPEIWKLVEW